MPRVRGVKSFYCKLCGKNKSAIPISIPQTEKQLRKVIRHLECSDEVKKEIMSGKWSRQMICGRHAPVVLRWKLSKKKTSLEWGSDEDEIESMVYEEMSAEGREIGSKEYSLRERARAVDYEAIEAQHDQQIEALMEEDERTALEQPGSMLGAKPKDLVSVMDSFNQAFTEVIQSTRKRGRTRTASAPKEHKKRGGRQKVVGLKRYKFYCKMCCQKVVEAAVTVPSRPWDRAKFLEMLIDDRCTEAVRQEIADGKWDGRTICASHAPGMVAWKNRWCDPQPLVIVRRPKQEGNPDGTQPAQSSESLPMDSDVVHVSTLFDDGKIRDDSDEPEANMFSPLVDEALRNCGQISIEEVDDVVAGTSSYKMQHLCLICKKLVSGPCYSVPRNIWKRRKLAEFLVDCDPRIKTDIVDGYLEGRKLCTSHAPGKEEWEKKFETMHVNPPLLPIPPVLQNGGQTIENIRVTPCSGFYKRAPAPGSFHAKIRAKLMQKSKGETKRPILQTHVPAAVSANMPVICTEPKMETEIKTESDPDGLFTSNSTPHDTEKEKTPRESGAGFQTSITAGKPLSVVLETVKREIKKEIMEAEYEPSSSTSDCLNQSDVSISNVGPGPSTVRA